MTHIQIIILREAIALGDMVALKYDSKDLAHQMALLRTYDTSDKHKHLVLQDLEILASNVYALDPWFCPVFTALANIFRSTL